MNHFEMLLAAILVNFFDAYVVYNYFEIFFEKRESVRGRHVVSLFGSLWIIASIIQAYQNNSIIFMGSAFVTSFIVALVLYRSGWLAKAFLTLLLLFISAFSEVMVALFMITFSGISVEAVQSNPTAQFIGGTMSKLLMFFIIKIVGYIKKSPVGKTSLLNWIALFSVPALSLPILQYVFDNNIQGTIRESKLSTVVIISVLYINGFLFFAFENLMKQSQERGKLEIAERQLSLQSEHYKELNEVNERVLGLKHDLKNYLIGVNELIEEGRYAEVQERIGEWNQRLYAGSKVFTSGNPVIDSLISNKWNLAIEEGIRFEPLIQIPPELPIDPIDACILLGNGLDNAIDACRRMGKKGKDPFIRVNMKTVGNTLQISFVNSFNETEREKWVDLKTIKSDKIGHGYGLTNIENTAKKYKGIVRKTSNSGEFTLDIILLMNS